MLQMLFDSNCPFIVQMWYAVHKAGGQHEPVPGPGAWRLSEPVSTGLPESGWFQTHCSAKCCESVSCICVFMSSMRRFKQTPASCSCSPLQESSLEYRCECGAAESSHQHSFLTLPKWVMSSITTEQSGVRLNSHLSYSVNLRSDPLPSISSSSLLLTVCWSSSCKDSDSPPPSTWKRWTDPSFCPGSWWWILNSGPLNR